jgi:hypothetical protein
VPRRSPTGLALLLAIATPCAAQDDPPLTDQLAQQVFAKVGKGAALTWVYHSEGQAVGHARFTVLKDPPELAVEQEFVNSVTGVENRLTFRFAHGRMIGLEGTRDGASITATVQPEGLVVKGGKTPGTVPNWERTLPQLWGILLGPALVDNGSHAHVHLLAAKSLFEEPRVSAGVLRGRGPGAAELRHSGNAHWLNLRLQRRRVVEVVDADDGAVLFEAVGVAEPVPADWTPAPVEDPAAVEANERGAVAVLNALYQAQLLFRDADGDADGALDYAEDLTELQEGRVNGKRVLTRLLKGYEEFGYVFELCRGPGEAAELLWQAVARPKAPGKTGSRSFLVGPLGEVVAWDRPLALDPLCRVPSFAKQVQPPQRKPGEPPR